MKKLLFNVIFLIPILGIIIFTNSSYSSGPDDWTVTGGCTCHSGAPSANTSVTINFNGGNLYYNNGQTYPLSITVASSVGKPRAGFALETNIGTYGPATGNTQISGNVWKHTAPKATSGSPSSATWTINWTAPASGNTQLNIVAAGLAAGNPNNQSNDEFNFAPSMNIPLPLLFKSFTAQASAGVVSCNWTVGGQFNIKQYELQSSVDGIQFNSIHTLSSTSQLAYTVMDDNKYTTNKVWYRVKTVEQDGAEKFSPVREVLLNQVANEIKIFPTLLRDASFMQIEGNSNTQIYIYGAQGNLMASQSITSGITNIPTASWSSGMYFVFSKNQTTGDITFLQKLLK